jgi:hypothetical protein
LTAKVEVSGLPEPCERRAACTVLVMSDIIGCGLDEYGDIRFDDEKARLDNLAIELRNDPGAKGHIVGYGGRRARVGEARRRIERAKNYLVGSRKIAPERIVTMDGGYRENLTVELWVLPAEAGPLPVAPTVDPSEVTIIGTRPKRRPKR